MINLKEYSDTPKRLSEYLPWACSPAEGVILNKDGSFQKTFHYRGPDLESATEAELIAVMVRANNVFRRFGSGWALFFEASRNPALDYPDSDFGDAASWLVEQERLLRFEETADQYESSYYLTLLWLPPIDATGRAEKALIERSEKHDAKGWRDRMETFIAQAARAFDLLAQTLKTIEPLSDAETLTYLHECVSTKRHPITPPEIPVFLDAILAFGKPVSALTGQNLFSLVLIHRDKAGGPAIGKALPVQIIQNSGDGGRWKAKDRQCAQMMITKLGFKPAGERLIGKNGVEKHRNLGRCDWVPLS